MKLIEVDGVKYKQFEWSNNLVVNNEVLDELYKQLEPIVLSFSERFLPDEMIRIEYPFGVITIESK